jgi:heat shock protein HslJ
MKYLLPLLLLLFACSPESDKMMTGTIQTYWINSLKVPCTGVGPQSCLQVKKGTDPEAEDWQLFYDSIEGFAYEPGYRYELRVREIEKPANQTPADASSISYTLEEMVSKTLDGGLRLHDIWALSSVDGIPYEPEDNPDTKHPILEINLTEQRVMGNDGCNNFSGGMTTAGDDGLQFNQMASTRMACPDQTLSNRLIAALQEVRSYQLEGLELQLRNAREQVVLTYRKVD